MIFGRILFLILTFILSSCSTSLKVNPGVCEGKVFLGNFVESKDFKTKKNFQFEHKILSSFSYRGNAEVIYLDQVLEDKNIDCSSVKFLGLSLRNTWVDATVSLVPFITKSTLIISGKVLKLSQKNKKKDKVSLAWIKKNVVNLLK